MQKKDKIILVIPSYNGVDYLRSLLPQLAEENYVDFDLEVVIVDNASTDDSVDFIKNNFSQFTLLENKENTGYVGANNLAYDYAKKNDAKYLYLLNQDTEITPSFLDPLYAFAKNNKFGSLQSKLKLFPETDKINTLGNVIHYLGFGYGSFNGDLDLGQQKIAQINYASGAGVLLSMEALNNLGYLFDETMFAYLEDLDLGWSLNLLGFENYLIPTSVVYHKYQFQRSMKQAYWFERNRLWVILKNYKIATLVFLFPAWLLMELGQIYFAWRNDYLKKKIKAYSFLFSAKEWKILLKKRKNIQDKRVINDRKILQTFSGNILFQPLHSTILNIANFIFDLYFQILRLFIVW
ncbi:glycosyltransferase family 2 protein [Candidatus Nomurabacteria bacterium]|nr:glycosyltransferase family 2 protein [Candidatus Nomurabacteria bacterium]